MAKRKKGKWPKPPISKNGLPSMKTGDKSNQALGALQQDMSGKMEGVQKPKGSAEIPPPPSATT